MEFPRLLVPAHILLCLLAVWVLAAAAGVPVIARGTARCTRSCGDVDVPYPFGLVPDCAFHDGFLLNCTNITGTPKLFHHYLFNLEVIKISVPDGKVWIRNSISRQCYNQATNDLTWMNLSGSPFMISEKDNKMFAMGCRSYPFVVTDSYIVGCKLICGDKTPMNGSCSGVGCCQAALPESTRSYLGIIYSDYNTSTIWKKFPCNYVAVMESATFNFSTTILSTPASSNPNNARGRVVVDWAITQNTCEQAKINNTVSYACVSNNSDCVTNDAGYRCECSRGYEGNPYLINGCTDINECLDNSTYPCAGICTNIPGSFTCSCPQGKHMVKDSCIPDDQMSVWRTPVVGASLGLVVLVIVVTNVYLIQERRKLYRMKQKYFRRHGGLLLFEEMRLRQGIAFKIFSEEELQHATNSFDEQQVIGRGGHGKVYKGVLKSDDEVAVKRCMIIDEQQKKEFGKEMLILSQINHRNIVKLLGCCLEVEVPMLVYEFIPNDTLFHLVHGCHSSHISLSTRLKIAYESADALAYLHSCASPPIIHGDVKSTNILLDHEYTAKVSDFGASILAPTDESQFVSLVQGTYGYLDPEYMQTCQLTNKSDVYSFGVVLLELLTRKKPLNFKGPEDEKSLAVRFISVSKEGRLEELLDNQIKNEENMGILEEIANLANQYLEMYGVNRPSMKEVSERLDMLRKAMQHPWAQQNPEETESLLGESSMIDSQMANTTYFSIEKKAFKSLGSGR